MPYQIVRNDITKMKVDAIVNAANNTLLGGGGVDGAIHHAAGPELLAECLKLNGCETGRSKITKGYNLPAKYVIHTVGPIWQGGTANERELLVSCYRTALELAAEYECESIAFPRISTGTNGFPVLEAMEIALETVNKFLINHDMDVYLVEYNRESIFRDTRYYREAAEYVDAHLRGHAPYREEQLQKRRPPIPSLEESVYMSNSMDVEDIDWDAVLKNADKGFTQTLLDLIDERGMKDSECYGKANVDKRLFSKIHSNLQYKPSKPTVFAFAFALELSLSETNNLLEKAGFTISHSSQFDLIMEFFIKSRFYDVMRINEVLYERNLPQLGSAIM